MSIYNIKVIKSNGEEVSLENYKNKILLIVNTATLCGLTPQYEGLEYLYKKYRNNGFEILDFPCNQFGNQAPGSDDEIHRFCKDTYNITFEQFKKIDVNGDNASPLFNYLKNQLEDDEISEEHNTISMKAILSSSVFGSVKKGDIKWNFTKFIVNKEGFVVKRYSPIMKPQELEGKIRELLLLFK
ncbi:glutathione peroxidase [Neocallimastix lanati (nom. inval.)]|uniref:Glutathione peroxidase n=1 Tax=Neocallimastix californiae TaxID=1754190 RepID=A0A1Y2ATI8_9FUNG|nr:glutathione peroxidase [Neocallimastix sp. JGI-2020a]ORY25883.1 glutathione peroxidase [Neocallimastix californiae]|eukprot:ORY25883.1 glutathione peroxidase [Neocallimastix californiae]